jgi:hypothetical protein
MSVFSIIILILGFTVTAQWSFADSCQNPREVNSAIRCEGEHYLEAFRKRAARIPRSETLLSAYGSRFPAGRFTIDSIPHLHSTDQVATAFRFVRDSRFLNPTSTLNLVRRPSFLYPDDGCWIRAHLMMYRAETVLGTAVPRLYRIFVFGNLAPKTSNAPRGRTKVYWWYHTAPIARIGNEAYVLDPALEPGAPIYWKDWILRQNPNLSNVRIAICNSNVYGPHGACLGSQPRTSFRTAAAHQRTYLLREEVRQRNLGRDVHAVLGDHPPW